jgi:uncharacterized OB-fold protein
MVAEFPDPCIQMAYLDSAPFWDGARDRRLILQFCLETSRFQHPPRPISQFTGSRKLAWREASGKGSIYSWTIQTAPATALVLYRPLVSIVVDMAERFRFLSWLTGFDNQAIRRGAPVEVEWQTLANGRSWPAFRLV